MTTEEMVLAAVPGPRPEWCKEVSTFSRLVLVAQGQLGLKGAARVLDEHATALGYQVAEVARSRTPDGVHEAVYARCEPAGTAQEDPPVADVNNTIEQVKDMTSNLKRAVTGERS